MWPYTDSRIIILWIFLSLLVMFSIESNFTVTSDFKVMNWSVSTNFYLFWVCEYVPCVLSHVLNFTNPSNVSYICELQWSSIALLQFIFRLAVHKNVNEHVGHAKRQYLCFILKVCWRTMNLSVNCHTGININMSTNYVWTIFVNKFSYGDTKFWRCNVQHLL